jgi:hypothetical protein
VKRHRFDPFSFLFGAVFLTVGGSFLFRPNGATAAHPAALWPLAVVIVGSTLVVWAAARTVQGAQLRAASGEAANEGGDPGGGDDDDDHGSPSPEQNGRDAEAQQPFVDHE